MSFKLAHLSDVHLGPLPRGAILGHFSGKRIIGAASWLLRRRHHHLPRIANAVRDSIIEATPDHVALTGDLVNIAAWSEFPAATKWLKTLGAADKVSFTPGNHDAYVHVPWARGLNNFAPWMQGDKPVQPASAAMFPYVRLRRNIALIGVNSGVPQPWRKAGGELGTEQLARLEKLLQELGAKGFFRVLMIHHPPLPGLAVPRKALVDAAALQVVLVRQGCELAMHGHNHRSMHTWLATKSGPCPVYGVASASGLADDVHEAAGWNLFNIRRHQGRWTVELTEYHWDETLSRCVPSLPALLSPPQQVKTAG